MQIKLADIADSHINHSRDSEWWSSESARLFAAVASEFDGKKWGTFTFDEFELQFPFVQMGAVSSIHLFGLDELIIFSYYLRNKMRYSRALDIGANLGLHSIFMKKLGWEVNSFEPDPWHSELAREIFARNDLDDSGWHEAAVVPHKLQREVQFVRVVGNTTSSHVLGAKTPYGELETFSVRAVHFESLLHEGLVVKMDVEGLESDLLCSVDPDLERDIEIIAEIGSAQNAVKVFKHFSDSETAIYSQKNGYSKALTEKDLPTSYKEGSIILNNLGSPNW